MNNTLAEPRASFMPAPLDFHLPPELEAAEPPEARGMARDDVRLMVSYRADDRIAHTRFRELPHLSERLPFRRAKH